MKNPPIHLPINFSKEKFHLKFSGNRLPNNMLVPHYKQNENGDVVCECAPSDAVFAPITDALSCELASQLYAQQPEFLAQVDLNDPTTRAEKITSYCVRRFGSIIDQRAKIEKQIKDKQSFKEE